MVSVVSQQGPRDPSSEAKDDRIARVWDVLTTVPDPEIPVLNVTDLGIVRSVDTVGGGAIEVVITPTYTGCPATQVIAGDIRRVLDRNGFGDAGIITRLDPPWTTDWISEDGRRKLKEYGISPPGKTAEDTVSCPRCGSEQTSRVSQFGSTPCKALYRCEACLEPFDHFKCLQ